VNIWVRNELMETWHANPSPNSSGHLYAGASLCRTILFYFILWFQKFGDFSKKIAFLFPIYTNFFGKF